MAACRTLFCEDRLRERSRVSTKGKSTPKCLDTASALLVDRAARTSSDGLLDAIARAIASPRPLRLTPVMITAFSHSREVRGAKGIMRYLICLGFSRRKRQQLAQTWSLCQTLDAKPWTVKILDLTGAFQRKCEVISGMLRKRRKGRFLSLGSESMQDWKYNLKSKGTLAETGSDRGWLWMQFRGALVLFSSFKEIAECYSMKSI